MRAMKPIVPSAGLVLPEQTKEKARVRLRTCQIHDSPPWPATRLIWESGETCMGALEEGRGEYLALLPVYTTCTARPWVVSLKV